MHRHYSVWIVFDDSPNTWVTATDAVRIRGIFRTRQLATMRLKWLKRRDPYLNQYCVVIRRRLIPSYA